MNYLVGDIGNTYTKISILNDNFNIKKLYNIETKKVFNENYKKKFFKKIIKMNLNSKILFSSVVPKCYSIIKQYLKVKKFKVYEIKDLKIKNILKIKIKNYSQLGSDRISNAIGSSKFRNCIVIDFGTATTFDILKNGVYDGGVISPGIKLSIINLKRSTALLPLLNLKQIKKNYGKNTKDAMNTGFLWGYQGLINNIIKKILSNSKKNYKIILTGGYANFFKKYINYKTTIDKDITIKGLAIIFKKLL